MRKGLLLAALLMGVQAAWGGMLMYRPGQEYRTINTASYEIIIQKAGRVDILMISEAPVFDDAFPMAWLEGDSKPKPLPVDGRMSVREAVKDPLGEGQGMSLRKKTCTWTLRAYPTEPYFAVQVAYTNTSKKPVKVQALYPWCVGAPAKGGVFLGPAPQEAQAFVEDEQGKWIATEDGLKTGSAVCLYNKRTGRMLIAGFLTQDKGENRIQVERPGKAERAAFGSFRAACVYDPPVEVAPGAQLMSGVFYLSVAERSPAEGLVRFNRARAAVSGKRDH